MIHYIYVRSKADGRASLSSNIAQNVVLYVLINFEFRCRHAFFSFLKCRGVEMTGDVSCVDCDDSVAWICEDIAITERLLTQVIRSSCVVANSHVTVM